MMKLVAENGKLIDDVRKLREDPDVNLGTDQLTEDPNENCPGDNELVQISSLGIGTHTVENNKELTEEEEGIFDVINDAEPIGTRILLEVVQREISNIEFRLRYEIARIIVSYVLKRFSKMTFIRNNNEKIERDELRLNQRRKMQEFLSSNPAVCVSNPEFEHRYIYDKDHATGIMGEIFKNNQTAKQRWFQDIDDLRKRIAQRLPRGVDTTFLTDEFCMGLLTGWLRIIIRPKDAEFNTVLYR